MTTKMKRLKIGLDGGLLFSESMKLNLQQPCDYKLKHPLMLLF
jgi:hypothetical protein